MAAIALELAITRSGDAYAATLTARLPGADARLAAEAPIALNAEALRALEPTPDVYGAALTAMVFPPALREAWARARGAGEARQRPLRLGLALDPGDDALHALLWETLRDPLSGLPLARGEAVRLARLLPSASLADLTPPPRPDLRAVVAAGAAAPPGASPVDRAGLTAAALAGLADIPATLLDGREGRPAATLANLTAALRDGAPLLVLICHGALVEGEPYLWLDQAGDGPYRPVSGAAFVEALAQLARMPLFVVLAACQGGGTSYEALRAVGPHLARAGVGAVLAMRAQIPQATVAALLPPLFAELRRDGEIDRALAAARAALGAGHPWWLPVLWLRMRDGRLWREEASAPQPPLAGIHIGGGVGTVQVVTVTGGSVGTIIGSQENYGVPQPAGSQGSAAAPPAPGDDQAAGLRRRLEQHRATVGHYLGQLAITGSAHARPEVTYGLREARDAIRRLKGALRGMGVVVEDYPDDEE
ncbi:MAG: CHAT domain-containing protein [Oscillochloridaceae bacterium]|nr:CHAT domain-containing protein [Chloroflexaceae bacterium]MDW8392187.1 CHAT domain-containing protein [Oscillochloridaceae bacterium]